MLTSELVIKDRMSSFGDIVALSDKVDVWVMLSALFFPYKRGKFQPSLRSICTRDMFHELTLYLYEKRLTQSIRPTAKIISREVSDGVMYVSHISSVPARCLGIRFKIYTQNALPCTDTIIPTR